jgi:hypothetical protein
MKANNVNLFLTKIKSIHYLFFKVILDRNLDKVNPLQKLVN